MLGNEKRLPTLTARIATASRDEIMIIQPEFIESTAGRIAEELLRHGVPPEQRVMVTIGYDHELIPGRLASRMRVIAAGLTTDDDIDRLIEEAREEVQPLIK